MTIEGELGVRLDWDGRAVRSVSIRSTRPVASRVLRGRRDQEAPRLVSRLYSVCAIAQGSAAAASLGAAAQRAPSRALALARERAIALESLQEDARRLLIDLPQAIGETRDVASVAALRRSIAPWLERLAISIDGLDVVADDPSRCEAIDALVSASVIGERCSTFLSRADADSLRAWAASAATVPALVVRALLDRGMQGSSKIGVMPPIDRAAIESAVVSRLREDRAFARAPHWHGEPVETGALARVAGHPGIASMLASEGNTLATRVIARIVQVAQTVESIRAASPSDLVEAWSPRDGEGVACVQTARGLLLHYARSVDGIIDEYAIVAPTEWNFHPHGPLSQGLAGADATDRGRLERDARLVVQSLDPCVACRVEIADA